ISPLVKRYKENVMSSNADRSVEEPSSMRILFHLLGVSALIMPFWMTASLWIWDDVPEAERGLALPEGSIYEVAPDLEGFPLKRIFWGKEMWAEVEASLMTAPVVLTKNTVEIRRGETQRQVWTATFQGFDLDAARELAASGKG